jgi:predicted transcriptional regulator
MQDIIALDNNTSDAKNSAKIYAALTALDKGEFVPHEKVVQWVQSLSLKTPLPLPQSK